MLYTTHPEARQAFTGSLRELADYIDRHRALQSYHGSVTPDPVPDTWT